MCGSTNKQVKYSIVISSLSACHSCHGLNHHSKLYKDSSQLLPTKRSNRSLKISTTKPKRPSFQHHINKRCVCTSFIFVLSLSHFLLHRHHHRCSRSISDTFHNFLVLSIPCFCEMPSISHSIVALSLYHVKHTLNIIDTNNIERV